MKTFIPALFLTSFFILAVIFNSFSQHHANRDTLIEVYFSNQTTFNDLVKTKLELSERGIILNYSKLEFGKDGKLTKISYSFFGDKAGASDEIDNMNEQHGFIVNTFKGRKYDVIAGSRKQVEERRRQFEK